MWLRTLALTCCIVFFTVSVQACTAWEIAGNSTVSGGTIIAKNRDYTYGDNNKLKVINDQGLLKYVAIYSSEGNKGGVNEEGLVVLTLSAPSNVSNQENIKSKRVFANNKFNNSWILAHFRTVDETILALKNGQWITHPEFIALADKHKVAYIEIGPDGAYSVKSTDNGTLDHTNHYLEPSMQNFNPNKLGYEFKRWEKAEEQLSSKNQFEMEDIKLFTQDPVVWYKHPTIMTYASIVVNNTQDNETLIWVKIANPGEDVCEGQFTLKDALSGKVQFPK